MKKKLSYFARWENDKATNEFLLMDFINVTPQYK